MENTNWISIFFKEGKRIFVHGTDNYRRGIFRCDLTQDSAVLTMISVFVCVSLLLPCFPLYWFPFRQVFQTMAPSSSRCLTSPRQDPQKRNRSSFLQQCEQNPRSNSHWPELDHMLSHMLILQPITVAHEMCHSPMPEIRHPFPEESACELRWADVVKINHMKLTKEGMLNNRNDSCLVTHVEDTLSFQLLARQGWGTFGRQGTCRGHVSHSIHHSPAGPGSPLAICTAHPSPPRVGAPSNHLSSTCSSLRA